MNHYTTKEHTMTERCEAHARKGTGEGTCDTVLDGGVCPRSRWHLSYLVPGVGFLTAGEYLDLMERREIATWGSE